MLEFADLSFLIAYPNTNNVCNSVQKRMREINVHFTILKIMLLILITLNTLLNKQITSVICFIFISY